MGELAGEPLLFWIGWVYISLFCNGVLAVIQCHFLIKFSGMPNRRKYYFIYSILFYGIYFLDVMLPMQQFLLTLIGNILIGMAIAFLFSNKVLEQNYITSTVIAALIITANVLVEGIVTPLRSLLLRVGGIPELMVDLSLGLLILILTYGIMDFFARRYILKSMEQFHYLLVLAIPLVFISIVMRILIEFSYFMIRPGETSQDVIEGIQDYEFLILAIMAFFCVWGTLFTYDKTVKYFEAEREKGLLKNQIDVQKIYVNESKLRYEATRQFRHDFKNHIITLDGLLNRNEVTRALEYLNRFGEVSKGMTFPIHTGNQAMDALLGEKLAYAQSCGIEIKQDIVIPPTVKIDDFDLCAIFANAIDNAIKGCNSVAFNRKIDIVAKQNKGFFIVDIINNYEKESMTKGTGIGISTIKMVAEKYHGTVEISDEDNLFRISVILFFCVYAE